MMARPALRLDVELPRFELELSDEDSTLELLRPDELLREDSVDVPDFR